MDHKKIKTVLHGYSQIMLQENAWAGLLFFMAILISSIEINNIRIFYYSTFSGILSPLISSYLGHPKQNISKGLFGYNTILYSIALAVLFPFSVKTIILLIIGIASIVILTPIIIDKCLQNFPILTTPFIIMTWIACKINGYTIDKASITDNLLSENVTDYLSAFSLNYAEIFLLSSVTGGLLIMVGLLLCGRKLFYTTCAMSVLSIAVSMYDITSIRQDVFAGLYGYNIILITIAIYTFRTGTITTDLLSGFCSILFTLKSTAILSGILLPYSIPILTLPFVIGTWLYILIQKIVKSYCNK
ncbi:urea transporter [Salmonella enterica]|nr:urea transporter [Salmonella enterica]EKF0974714.1 urea transporter [Salmonella enterica]